jgi:hypothetical protein
MNIVNKINISSIYRYDLTWSSEPHIHKIDNKYNIYMGDVKEAVGRMLSGSSAMFHSRLYLDYVMRDKFVDRCGINSGVLKCHEFKLMTHEVVQYWSNGNTHDEGMLLFPSSHVWSSALQSIYTKVWRAHCTASGSVMEKIIFSF